VLAVVQLEDLGRELGLQGAVVVAEFGHFVLRHVSSSDGIAPGET
jgi:hypothetical protein